MLAKRFLFIGFSVLLALIAGCSNEENSVVSTPVVAEDTTWQIDIIDNEPVVTFEDGTITEGWNEYQTEVARRVDVLEVKDLSLSVRQWPDTVTDARLAGWGFSVMGYYVRFSAESNYLGGCIGRTVPHIGILLSRQYVNPPIVNIHVAVWSQFGRPCVGIYNSGGKGYFCWKMCGPSYTDIRNALSTAIVAAGVSYLMAEILASVIAPIVCLLIL